MYCYNLFSVARVYTASSSYLRHDRKVRVGGLFVRLSLLAVNTETFVCLQKCSDYKASAVPTFARTEAPDTQVCTSLLATRFYSSVKTYLLVDTITLLKKFIIYIIFVDDK